MKNQLYARSYVLPNALKHFVCSTYYVVTDDSKNKQKKHPEIGVAMITRQTPLAELTSRITRYRLEGPPRF